VSNPFIDRPPLIITNNVESSISDDANKALDRDFSERVMDNTSRLIIHPHSTTTKALFMTRENFRRTFDIALKNTKIKDDNILLTVNL
jgi:hypothetical protein